MCFVNAFFWISIHACHYVFHRSFHVRMTTFSIMIFQWSLWRWEFFSVEPISAKHLMFESIKFLFWTFGRGARWGAWSIWRWDHTSWAGYVSLSFFVLDLFVFTFEIQRAGYSRLPRFESVHGLNLGLYLSRNFVALTSCTSATFMFAFHFAFNTEWALSKCLLRHTCLILSHLLFCQALFIPRKSCYWERHAVASKLRWHGVQPSINHSAQSKLAQSQDADTGWPAWLWKKLVGSTLGRERLWCGQSRCPWRSQLSSADGHALTFCGLHWLHYFQCTIREHDGVDAMYCFSVCVSIYIP